MKTDYGLIAHINNANKCLPIKLNPLAIKVLNDI